MYRERLTITLDAELLQAIDSLVDKETLRNRSQTIEHLLREGIGLHNLKQAFIFVHPGYDPARLERVIRIGSQAGIRQYYLCSFIGQGTELATSIQQLHPDTTVETVPHDFGSGGALILRKANLDGTFLLARLDESTAPLPEGLLSPFIFHRQHHGPLTSFLHTSDGISYVPSGLSLAEPELLNSIPAGIAQLEDSVFPVLLKEAKVRAYPYSS